MNMRVVLLFLQSTLKHRDTAQMEYEVTLEELSRKKAEKEEVERVYLAFQALPLNAFNTKHRIAIFLQLDISMVET